MAVESGFKKAGQWISECCDVRIDYRVLFGETLQVDAVAL
jgi:hypothetical protein